MRTKGGERRRTEIVARTEREEMQKEKAKEDGAIWVSPTIKPMRIDLVK